MKIELGNLTPQQITQLASAQLGTPQTLSETSTGAIVRIPLLGLVGYKALDTTVQFTPGFGSITLNSMTLSLVTSANASLPYFTFSEAGITASTEAAGYTIGNTIASSIRKMMIGETADASFVSQYLYGDDTIVGNATASYFSTGAGNDRISGGGGADVIDGGSGTDTSVYREFARSDYLVSRLSTGTVYVATRDGTVDRNVNVENFEFSSGTVAASALTYLPGYTAVPAAAVQPVYRFYNDRDKAFFYTTSAAERDMIIRESTDPSYTPENGVWPYFYQGTTYEQAHSSAGSVPVYRFYNTKTGHHFFTTSVAERDMVQKESTDPSYGQPGQWTFVYEGEAFRAYTDPNHKDAAAVYRFYSPTLDRHFFTASAEEAAQIKLTGQWNDEGIGYWGES